MIGLLGLNHKNTSIDIREKLVFCEEDIKRLSPVLQKEGIEGAVVLSTCNRTEIYFETYDNQADNIFAKLENILLHIRKLDKDSGANFYNHTNKEVVSQLFRVISGLDSMALGEYQIVGQVKSAYAISKKLNILSPVLERLFNKAFEAGKRVRTSTGMNKGAVSISYAAVELLKKNLTNLNKNSILFIGAGQTNKLSLQNFLQHGCSNFTVVNRTLNKANELAQTYGGKTSDFEKIPDLIKSNDITVTCTASKKPIITKEMVTEALKERNNKPMYFVDLSVPRNVAHEVDDMEFVTVYDIDALNGIVEKNMGKRKAKIALAEEIINELNLEFMNWLDARALIPTFKSITDNFKQVNQLELNGFRKNEVQIDYNKATEYGDHITNKFIRLLIRNVKEITDNGRNPEYVNMVNELFDLNRK